MTLLKKDFHQNKEHISERPEEIPKGYWLVEAQWYMLVQTSQRAYVLLKEKIILNVNSMVRLPEPIVLEVANRRASLRHRGPLRHRMQEVVLVSKPSPCPPCPPHSSERNPICSVSRGTMTSWQAWRLLVCSQGAAFKQLLADVPFDMKTCF